MIVHRKTYPMRLVTGLLLLMISSMTQAQEWPYATLSGKPPIIIAHRGASGYLPEHTLEAYGLAIELGADFIEPDLVMTRDGVLVARHDRYLSTTTDVAAHVEFAGRKKQQDGRMDWFVEDFTLAELKTLRARQPFPERDTRYDDQFEIPTFAEVIELVQRRSVEQGRGIGLYPETKSPGYFRSLGLDMAPVLAEQLRASGLDGAEALIFVQSFEPEILVRLNSMIDSSLIILLYPGNDGAANLDWRNYAEVIDGIGPSKALLVTADGTPSGLVEAAHQAGLAVHPWTHRADAVPDGFAGTEAELKALFALGIDGLFSDFSDIVLRQRALTRLQKY